MGRIILIAAVLFAITLAIFIGVKLSQDALGIIVGVFLGVLASVPTSFGLIWIISRRLPPPGQQTPNQPPVLIVNPAPGGQQYLPQPSPNQFPALPPGQRNFRVIGSEAEINHDGGEPPWPA